MHYEAIVGVDYHPSVQQTLVNTDTGECGERRLNHSDGEAEKFYRELKAAGCRVRVGMEATGHARWFERLLAEPGFELWIGDPTKIKAKRVRKQKTDRLDAELLLQLLLEDRFPRVWVPSAENRDLRQLLWHRHRLVQMRTRITNQLQAVALNEGVRRKKALWSKSGRSPVRVASAASLGGTAPARLTGAAESIEPDDRGVKRSRGAASQASVRGVAPEGSRFSRSAIGRLSSEED